MNFLYIFLAALVPMIMGFIWYNPKVLGNAWMEAAGMTEEKMKGANMAVIFGVSFLLSLMLAFVVQTLVIHQYAINSLTMPEKDHVLPDGAAATGTQMMEAFKDSYRTFRHGVIHGAVIALFVVLPVMGTNALFERKGFKYIAVNVGYWLITLMIMGGILCKFVKFPA